MVIRGELTRSHVYRLHQIDGSAVVILRLAVATRCGLKRLLEAARLMRRHQFVFVLRRTKMRDKKIAPILNRVRRMKNVFFGVIEDEKNASDIQRRRIDIYERLIRCARDSASALALSPKGKPVR